MKRDLSHTIFEFTVFAILAIALISGIIKSDFTNEIINPPSQIQTNQKVIGEARNVMYCNDTSPPYAIPNKEKFVQVTIDGQWHPKQEECAWECRDGFNKQNGLCVDINECENLNISNCVNTQGGYVITENLNSIYATYPATNDGKEVIFPFLDEGDMVLADEIINNDYRISKRFSSSKNTIFEEVEWDVDPFEDKYWRFLYYSLRPTRHLLYAYQENPQDEIYKDKIIEIISSFYNNPQGFTNKSDVNVWDLHGSAFRSMVLTNTWWKLREKNVLPEELSNQILEMLQYHGEFLKDSKNFEKEHNHGINQAAALFLIGVNFPDLENATEYKELGIQRLELVLDKLVDDDGILVENSPYYHFYSLRLFWNIHEYSVNNDIFISNRFDEKLKQMVNYGVYIIQPNLEVPTIGASLSSKVNFKKEYNSIALENPYFMYVVTQGKEGEIPPHKSVHFPIAGQTIMRSGWGEKTNYENETYLVFDVGNYRTSHSDLDALSFHLYANTQVIMPDAGLYTYEDNKYKDYFHKTFSHNTVLVDGKSQVAGNVAATKFKEEDAYTYQSGKHNLYDGVVHKRGILLIDKDYILIIDKLESSQNHMYTQQFLIAPQIKLQTINGSSVGIDNNSKEVFTLFQLENKSISSIQEFYGSEIPYRGWCSINYKEAIRCNQILFNTESQNANYITLIKIGDAKNIKYNVIENSDDTIKLQITNLNEKYDVSIKHFAENTLYTKERIDVIRGELK